MSKKQIISIPLTVDELSDLIRKIVTDVVKENQKGYKTEALAELADHAYGYLWPFPDRMLHFKAIKFDFNTNIEVFNIKLMIVFEEMESNRIQTSDDYIIQGYADRVIKIMQEVRKQVNQFFRTDTPADKDYTKKLMQIEAEGVIEEPESGLTPADSLSETKLEFPVEALALYLNKICLWAEFKLTKKLSSW